MTLADRRWTWVAGLIAGIVVLAVLKGAIDAQGDNTNNTGGDDNAAGDLVGYDFRGLVLGPDDPARMGGVDVVVPVPVQPEPTPELHTPVLR